MFQFRSKITIKILGYFFLNPQKTNYVNELANLLSLDVGNLFRKLKELEGEGILYSEKRGNQKYYGLNKNYSLLKEMKRMYNAKYGVVGILKEKLKKIKKLDEAYIFGSYAKGNFQQESDVDILLIGEHSSLKAKLEILPLEKTIGREINIIDISMEELKLRRKKNDDFIKNIFSQKTIKIY
ncbi:nucleotidyltransferase domain-containing protein [Patescibacteria group bacterium]|nr:nucleotidyltransferase domain-containing protein [Patescibacteria group bacterium]